jgi:hypothetical protein
MKRALICTVLALTFAMTAAAGPMPPGKWWRQPAFVQELGLSIEQQTRLDMIFRLAANELIDLRAEADKTSIAIHAEIDQPQPNRENLRRLASHLSETQGKLFDRELMMLVDMRGVLTDDQWARLRAEVNQSRPPRKRE